MLLRAVIVALAFQAIYGHLKGIDEQNECYDGICWKDMKYPAEDIMAKLNSSDMSNLNTFGKFGKPEATENPDMSCDLCEHDVSLRVTPLTIIDEGRKYFVVNTENYQQNITLNICRAPEEQNGSRCLGMRRQEILPNDLEAACEQKHTTILLLCLDEDKEVFVGKTIRYPSACVCTIKILNN